MKRLASVCFFMLCSPGVFAQDDVADIPSKELRAGNDEHKRYFLIGPVQDAKAPDEGFGLVVIVPGGDGSAEFHPFVKRIARNALPDNMLAAQPVAVKWTKAQKIVWPTAKNKVDDMKFTTEEFVDAVIDDVGGRAKLNPKRIYTLSWSSSGPAAYAISLTGKRVAGSFVAMSVFKPNDLPPLEKARGHAYYLYHSMTDRVCPFRMAEQAVRDLEKNGATVTLKSYDGGHGWRGGLYDNIREGIAWLDKHAAGTVGKME